MHDLLQPLVQDILDAGDNVDLDVDPVQVRVLAPPSRLTGLAFLTSLLQRTGRI